MTYKELIALTLVKLEEYSPFLATSSLSIAPNYADKLKPIEHYVEENVEQAVNEVLMSVPLHLLHPIKDENSEIHRKDLVGFVVCPHDFLRLHTFQMEGWERPVHVCTYENEPSYNLQFNRWTRGTPQKPVVVLSKDEEGFSNVLWYYSVKDANADLKHFSYIRKYYKGGCVQDNLSAVFALNTAIKVLNSYGMMDNVTILTKERDELLTSLANS